MASIPANLPYPPLLSGLPAGPPVLPALLQRIDERTLSGLPLEQEERLSAVAWVAEQYDPASRYMGFTLPGAALADCRLFTGERLRTRIGALSVLGLEACRALLLLDPFAPAVQQLLSAAQRRLETACYANGCVLGECAHAGIAVLRFRAAGGSSRAEELLAAQAAQIRTLRDGAGRWRKLPFYYTLLALTEVPSLAQAELRYAAPGLETLLRRSLRGPAAARRQQVIEKALSLV